MNKKEVKKGILILEEDAKRLREILAAYYRNEVKNKVVNYTPEQQLFLEAIKGIFADALSNSDNDNSGLSKVG